MLQLNNSTEVRIQILIQCKTVSLVGDTTIHSLRFVNTFIIHVNNHHGF
jgi:hypothetical protein